MPAIGGSIESISIRGRQFPVASDADVTRQLGGFTNEIQMNGDGTGRKIMTRVAWMLEGIQVEISDVKADSEFLQEVADSLDWVPITITLASGTTYQGTGTISDTFGMSTQSTTATLTLSGPGTLTQQ